MIHTCYVCKNEGRNLMPIGQGLYRHRSKCEPGSVVWMDHRGTRSVSARYFGKGGMRSEGTDHRDTETAGNIPAGSQNRPVATGSCDPVLPGDCRQCGGIPGPGGMGGRGSGRTGPDLTVKGVILCHKR